ncbi:transcriptional regulator [Candidatus Odyssella thessalonicensis]|uniref:transcriptional regulator n=1 Tax=Candidatus Odyssella thessalonicensis TaxID=84647 RepID=UPI000302A7CD|nr:YdaS family helix-turn-helix protein [Candidatus Odyssella thessalonicensis]
MEKSTHSQEYNKEEVQRAVDIMGSAWKLAKVLGIRPANIYRWLKGLGFPDPINCLRIEKATQGRVKARDILPRYDWENVI